MNTSTGLKIDWDALFDSTSFARSCIVYNIFVVRERDMTTVVQSTVSENTIEISELNILEPGVRYSATVTSKTLIGSCDGEPASITCETSSSLLIPGEKNYGAT